MDAHTGELSPDLIPYLAKDEIGVFLVRLMTPTWSPLADSAPPEEIGALEFQVLERLRSSQPKPESVLRVEARRFSQQEIRIRNRFDHWNALTLNAGDLLILAAVADDSPIRWRALAANAVASPDASKVQAVRSCLIIAKTEAAEKKKALLEEALLGPDDTRQFFALHVLANRQELGRESGAALVNRALASGQLNANIRLEYGLALTRSLFDRAGGASASNQQVTATLVKELVNEKLSSRKVSWGLWLASVLRPSFAEAQAEDQQVRAALIRSTGINAKTMNDQVVPLLPQAKKDERVILEDLLKIWTAALTQV